MTLSTNKGKGGRGKKCANCGRFTVFNNICNNCTAEYTLPRKAKAVRA